MVNSVTINIQILKILSSIYSTEFSAIFSKLKKPQTWVSLGSLNSEILLQSHGFNGLTATLFLNIPLYDN